MDTLFLFTHFLFSRFYLVRYFICLKLTPRALSGFGVIAALLMFIEILATIFGKGISSNMMLPIGLIQLIFPFWLLFKGLNSSKVKPRTT